MKRTVRDMGAEVHDDHLHPDADHHDVHDEHHDDSDHEHGADLTGEHHDIIQDQLSRSLGSEAFQSAVRDTQALTNTEVRSCSTFAPALLLS